MKRAKLNNDKITALYCRLSKDDGTNNESMSMYKGHVKENQDRTPRKENAGQVMSADKEPLSSIEQFAEQISGYAGITELNFKIINQLIEKILVSEPVEVDGQKIQRLTIHYKFIGALETLE